MMGNDIDSGFLIADVLKSKRIFTDIELLYKSKSGASVLYRAKRDGKWHILKTLKPEYAGSELLENLLMKEYGYSYDMDHPNIVRALGFEEVQGIGACIILEYIDGITLLDFIRAQKITTDRAIRIIKELCCALDYIHCKQIVHRDLRPENIMITHNGNHVKLIDFGFADSNDAAILKASAGTPKYVSPEVVAGQVPDGRADIYALGIIITDMFLGKPRGVFKTIASKCSCVDRDKRYQYADEISAELFYKRKTPVYIAIALIVVLIAVVLLWSQRGDVRLLGFDGIENSSGLKIEHIQDTIKQSEQDTVAEQKFQVAYEKRVVVDSPKVYTGELVLSNGKYVGEISAGKPHGKGTMYYSEASLINSKDEKRRFSEKGDTFIGKFYNGVPEYGKLYNSDNELKAVLNFGR